MSANVVDAIAPKLEEKPELTEAEKKELLEEAIQKRAKLAESRLEMVRLFLQNGKQDIAERRLKELLENFAGTSEAETAREMLSKL